MIKLCIVYDVLVKFEGGFLFNDVFEKGLNFLLLMWGIFFCFCIGKVGVVGDFEKVFLQLMFEEKDWNVCCFLWFNFQGEIEEYRYRKVIFGVKLLLFLLQVVLKYYLEGFVGELQIVF